MQTIKFLRLKILYAGGKLKEKIYIFFFTSLKSLEKRSPVQELDPDPLVRGKDPRIWIRTKISQIPNTAAYTHLEPGLHLHLGHENAAPEPRVNDHLAEVGAGGLQGGQRGHVQHAHDQADHLLRQVQDGAPGGGRNRSTGGQGCGSGSGFNRISGSGPRRAKITHKSSIFFLSSCFEMLDGLF